MGHSRAVPPEEEDRELPQHHRNAAERELLRAGRGRGRRRQHPGDGGHDAAHGQAADGKLPHMGQVGSG